MATDRKKNSKETKTNVKEDRESKEKGEKCIEAGMLKSDRARTG